MNHFRNPIVLLGSAIAVAACVTINVYFPEAAAERAADRFIQDVIGGEVARNGEEVSLRTVPKRIDPVGAVLDFLIPSAHAQAQAQAQNIDIESPQINAIKQRMAERHSQHLSGWFASGAIGLGNDGLVEIRDRSAVALAERRNLEQVVSADNADRNAVYREIAVANGQPEWEDRIRQTFAQRWIANAASGWYYRDAAGNWQQK
ncbi:MAG: YdbL family protein [Wenzhouxiangellaceae bacterium]